MTFQSTLRRFWSFVIRNRIPIQDLLLVAFTAAVTAYALYDIDVYLAGSTTVEYAIEPDELPLIGAVLCIGMLIFSWRRISEQKRESRRRLVAEQHARELAMQDTLTGLPNRRQFAEALSAAVAAPPGAGESHVVLALDLNGFKQINDVYGHGAGDEVLTIVGQRLLSAARQGDIVARLGGDEFAVIARHVVGAEAATSIALRLMEAFNTPISAAGVVHTLGAGIGIAMFPFPDYTAEQVMRRADVALYKAKADYTTSLRFFEDGMDRHVRERELMERELRAAIAANDIQPYFQPLLNLKTRKIIGFEALARWTHSELGSIAPERFIPIAEETGQISELSDQLLRSACAAALTWPQHVTLAFNISPVQLRDRALAGRMLQILNDTGFSPSRLEVEITESALVRDLEAAKEVLGGLRDAGVRIALDDFGTGYSSLYHLTNFKIDKIKIDRSFVSRMRQERESEEIVTALIGLGRGLGMSVIAEGIETDVQDADLTTKGCDQGQGYLFGKAMTAHEATAIFELNQPISIFAA